MDPTLATSDATGTIHDGRQSAAAMLRQGLGDATCSSATHQWAPYPPKQRVCGRASRGFCAAYAGASTSSICMACTFADECSLHLQCAGCALALLRQHFRIAACSGYKHHLPCTHGYTLSTLPCELCGQPGHHAIDARKWLASSEYVRTTCIERLRDNCRNKSAGWPSLCLSCIKAAAGVCYGPHCAPQCGQVQVALGPRHFAGEPDEGVGPTLSLIPI